MSDRPQPNRNEQRDRPSGLLSFPAKLALVVFLLVFVAGGIGFAVLSGGLGAPLIFPIAGAGLALFGILVLVSTLTKKTRGMPRIDPDSPIRDTTSAPAAPAAKCPGCGARRRTNDVFCSYCGAALV